MMLPNEPDPADPSQRRHCSHRSHPMEDPWDHAQMPDGIMEPRKDLLMGGD